MANQRSGCVRVELQLPPELVAGIDARSGGEPRNVSILRALAKSFGVRLTADQIAPRRGRPKKSVAVAVVGE